MFDREMKKRYLMLSASKFNKHEVVLFHIMDHESEKEFSFADRPYTFEDLESGKRSSYFHLKLRKHIPNSSRRSIPT